MIEDNIIKWTNLEKVLNEYGMELRNLYRDNLIKNDRIASGDLLNSVEYIVQSDNMHISVSLKLAKYWKYVEWDTKPHFPPVYDENDETAGIEGWIKIKHVIYDNRNEKLPTERQLAFMIAKKISEEGTKGTHDLHDAINEVNDRYREKIKDAIATDIKENSTVIFTEFFYKNS